jgi:hypothetical protein
MTRTCLFLLTSLFLAACDTIGGAPPLMSPPPAGGVPTYKIQPGVPTGVQPGVQAGYSITSSGPGAYRIFWTGDVKSGGEYHLFTGRIHTPGHFTQSIPGCSDGSCALEAGDSVSSPTQDATGQTIEFNTYASVATDGLDFTVDMEPVTFDLDIDGAAFPNLVFFPDAQQSGTVATVASTPFNLVTH